MPTHHTCTTPSLNQDFTQAEHGTCACKSACFLWQCAFAEGRKRCIKNGEVFVLSALKSLLTEICGGRTAACLIAKVQSDPISPQKRKIHRFVPGRIARTSQMCLRRRGRKSLSSNYCNHSFFRTHSILFCLLASACILVFGGTIKELQSHTIGHTPDVFACREASQHTVTQVCLCSWQTLAAESDE